MTNSRAKGCRGELELARWLTERGHPARRGQQYSGSPDSPDVVCPSLPIHFEAKRTERLRLHEAMQQAVDDAGKGMVPIVAHKANRKPWLAIMRLSDLMALIQSMEAKS
jgi:Holliday junction resolvase